VNVVPNTKLQNVQFSDMRTCLSNIVRISEHVLLGKYFRHLKSKSNVVTQYRRLVELIFPYSYSIIINYIEMTVTRSNELHVVY